MYLRCYSDEEDGDTLDWLPMAPEIEDPEEPGWGQLEVSAWLPLVIIVLLPVDCLSTHMHVYSVSARIYMTLCMILTSDTSI